MKRRTKLLLLVLGLLIVVAGWQVRTAGDRGPGQIYAQQSREAQTRGDVAAATIALRQAVLAEPGNGGYHADLGNLYLEQGRYELAASQLQIAAHLYPDGPHVFCLLSQALVQLRRRGEALEALELALQQAPSCAHALTVRGEQRLRDDNLKAALADFLRAIELEPGSALAYQKAGYILYQTNQDAEARRLLRQCLRVGSGDPGSHMLLAQTYLRAAPDAEAAAQAEEHLRAATRGNPQADRAYAALGQLYRRQGDTTAARTAFEAALKTAPDSEEALYGLSQVLQAQGDAEGAQRYLRRFNRARGRARERAALLAQATAEPENVQIRLEIARLALADSSLLVAERMLNQAVRLQPDLAELRELRGQLFVRLGKQARATREFALASRLPTSPE